MSNATAPAADLEVPVLIAGGSLVGLTTSLLLSSYGIENLVVERHSGTAIHPRAASFHQRTVEIFRHAGVQDEVEKAAALDFEQNGAIVAVESLSARNSSTSTSPGTRASKTSASPRACSSPR